MLSSRLREVVDALPLRPGLRVLEIGCGPGAAAIEVAKRVGPTGHVLAIDRSTKAIDHLLRTGSELVEAKRLSVLTVAVEELELPADEPRFDLAFAVRVGALDGRHPELEAPALERIRAALTADGRLFVDGGEPLREIDPRNR
jgi:precorrin-6B methylase 2